MFMTAPSRRRLGGGFGGAGSKLVRFERLDVFKTIDDAAADLDELWTFPGPAPPLQRAVTDVPSSRQLDLVEMSDCHLALLGFVSKTCEEEWQSGGEELGRSQGGMKGGIAFLGSRNEKTAPKGG
jgi:hypothetical protein